MNTPTQTDRPEACPSKSSQLGRDALLVHGLAFVFAGATASTAAWIGQAPEIWRAIAVGLTATFVLLVWSAILAVRGLIQGKSSRLPVLVFALLSVEVTAACLLFLWAGCHNWLTDDLALPVLLPVFLVTSWVAFPVARWRVRRAEKREVDAGAAPWSRRRRLKHGLAWGLAVAIPTLAVLLPLPLFLYCAHRYMSWRQPAWQAAVVDHTPTVVGEATASVLSSLKVDWLYRDTLRTGRVTEARLLSGMTSTDGITKHYAFDGLERGHRQVALDIATKLGEGRFGPSSPALRDSAGECLGRYGSAEQIRPFLEPTRKPEPSYDFLDGLIRVMSGRQDLLPDLERFCQVDSPLRANALYALAECAPAKEVTRIWRAFLAEKDPLRRAQAVQALCGRIYRDELQDFMLATIVGGGRTLRRELVIELASDYLPPRGCELRRPLVRALLPLLDDEDFSLRCAATLVLATETQQPWSLQNQCQMLYRRAAGQDGPAPPETPEERELVKNVRDAALKWLGEQK